MPGSYIRDGHQLIIAVGDDRLIGRIVCPALMNSCAPCAGPDGCRVQHEFAAVGLGEFTEWQHQGHDPIDTPCEIAWTILGEGEMYEFCWRPVAVAAMAGLAITSGG